MDYRDRYIYWIFVHSGSMLLTNKQLSNQEIVKAGEMFLWTSGYGWEVESLSECYCTAFISTYPTEFTCKIVIGIENIPVDSTYCPKLSILDPLKSYLDSLDLYIKKGINCEHLYKEKQDEAFILLNHYYPKQEVASFLYPYTVKKETFLKKLITDYGYKSKSIDDLAQMCGYSIQGFRKVFKSLFDQPIYEWILQQKTEKLHQFLSEDEVNLKMIINEMGFSSPAHLTQFCKKRLGMVPTSYMKKLREQKGT